MECVGTTLLPIPLKCVQIWKKWTVGNFYFHIAFGKSIRWNGIALVQSHPINILKLEMVFTHSKADLITWCVNHTESIYTFACSNSKVFNFLIVNSKRWQHRYRTWMRNVALYEQHNLISKHFQFFDIHLCTPRSSVLFFHSTLPRFGLYENWLITFFSIFCCYCCWKFFCISVGNIFSRLPIPTFMHWHWNNKCYLMVLLDTLSSLPLFRINFQNSITKSDIINGRWRCGY